MTLTVDGAVAAETHAKADVRSWKAPIALAVFTVLYAILILAAPRVGVTTFRISTQADALQLPEIVLPVVLTTWVVFGLLVLLTVFSAVLVRGYKRTPLWLIAAYIIIAIVGFLTWAAAGATIPVAGLLAGAVALAIPLIYGALAGV
ncbi:MAG: ABC transporter permease, partial [Microbacterium sp.]